MGKRVRKLTRRNKIMGKSLRRNSKISRKSKVSRKNKSIKKRRVNRKTLRRYKLRGGANALFVQEASAEAAKNKALTPDNENHDEIRDLIYTLVKDKFNSLKPETLLKVVNRLYNTYITMLFECRNLEEEYNFKVRVANIIVNNLSSPDSELINKIYTEFNRDPPQSTKLRIVPTSIN